MCFQNIKQSDKSKPIIKMKGIELVEPFNALLTKWLKLGSPTFLIMVLPASTDQIVEIFPDQTDKSQTMKLRLNDY